MEAIVIVIVVVLILVLAALIILTALSARRSKNKRNSGRQYRANSVSNRDYRIEAPEPEEGDTVRPITTVFSQILEEKARPGSAYMSADQLESEFPINVKPVEETIREWVQRLRQRNGNMQTPGSQGGARTQQGTAAAFTAAGAATMQSPSGTTSEYDEYFDADYGNESADYDEEAVIQEIVEAIEAGFDDYDPNAEHVIKEIVEAIEAGFDNYDPNNDSVVQDIIGAIEDGFDDYDANTAATIKGIVEAIEAGFKR